MSFIATFKLTNGLSADYVFATKSELDTFLAGVSAAINWPRRTHQGVTVTEVNSPVLVKPAAPVVVEKKEEKPNA